MNYFVLGPNGQEYGPADLVTLNQWVKEGRIGPQTMIRNADTSITLPATQVEGLYPAGVDWTQPPGSYYRPTTQGYPAQGQQPGQGEVIAAWILGAACFVVCCPVLPGVGIYLANKASALGNPSGNAAKIFNIVILSLSLLVYLFYVAIFGFAIAAGGMN